MTTSNSKVFLDSNIWIYHFAQGSGQKSSVIEEILLVSGEILISTQVLGEIYHVFIRKKILTSSDVQKIVGRLVNDFNPIAIASQQVIRAIEISERYGFSYWDRLIIATALLADCAILYTEDMQHGQIIENTLKVINPFI